MNIRFCRLQKVKVKVKVKLFLTLTRRHIREPRHGSIALHLGSGWKRSNLHFDRLASREELPVPIKYEIVMSVLTSCRSKTDTNSSVNIE
jgi:hypothetical protein